LVTGAVTAASGFLPDRYVATAVGFVFLGATWALVWRGDDARVGVGLARRARLAGQARRAG
jgi:hypothetical protein